MSAATSTKSRISHGFKSASSPFRSEYRSWQKAKERCNDPNNKSYRSYGALGIVMCKGWSDSPESFVRDMGHKPTSEHSLDRKDNQGNYSCGHCDQCVQNGWVANVRWSTRRVQNRNTSRGRYIEAFGRNQLLIEWAEEFGLSPDTISTRLKKNWTPEKAVSEPSRKGGVKPAGYAEPSQESKEPIPKVLPSLKIAMEELRVAWGIVCPGAAILKPECLIPESKAIGMLREIQSLARDIEAHVTLVATRSASP